MKIRFKRILVFLTAALFAAAMTIYVVKLADLYFHQEKYIYRPAKEWDCTPRAIGLPYEDIRFNTSDGVELSGWFVPAKNPKGTILFCHGNFGNISYEFGPMRFYHELGFNFFVFDYRGYGKSGGSPTEEGTALDADAAWDYLTQKKLTSAKDIIVIARSFGGAVGIPLAVRKNPRALQVEASFSSMKDIARDKYPYAPVAMLLKYKYDSKNSIKDVHCPVLIIHSRDDETIPIKHGRLLFQEANEPKQYFEFSGPHNNKDDAVSQAEYRKGVILFHEWLNKNFPAGK